jgi:hypothetical protein
VFMISLRTLLEGNEHPVIGMRGISADGKWLAVYARAREQEAGGTVALPLDGGTPVKIYGTGVRAQWSRDGKLLFLTTEHDRTYILPLPPDRMWPAVPNGGFKSEDEIAALPGVRRPNTRRHLQTNGQSAARRTTEQ